MGPSDTKHVVTNGLVARYRTGAEEGAKVERAFEANSKPVK